MIPELIGKETKAGSIQRTLRWVEDEEHRLLMHGDRRDPITLPFMPFQPSAFTAIMFDVVAETNGPIFLDVGCGTGTKMALAKEVFGLTPWGIEIDRPMADQADARFPWAVIAEDARRSICRSFYSQADIVWMYRPFRDPDAQTELEKFVMAEMKHGAILAGGKWQMDNPPPWIPVVDDWDDHIKCGAWMKP